ncbi:MAG: PAS domain S-box protein [Bacteroidales bacterium]|nr:PAS domain S-box protein [Bacteroidales bacterium]MDD4293399.1 PAS domain S-box protein [Bacteroidales bacterium]
MHRTKSHESLYASSLIEASLDPLVVISTGGKITDMNHAMENITGVNHEKLVGTDFFEYFTDAHKAHEVYLEVFAKGSVKDSFLTFRHKNGKLTDVLFNGSVYNDDKGNLIGAVIVARDIAEQKWALELLNANKELAFQNDEKEKRAAELIIANKELLFQNTEKEKRAAELIIANKELLFQNKEKEKRAAELILANYARGLIEASRDPLVTISPEGKITDMNEALANVTGMTREELTGTDFFDYFTEPQKAREVYQEVFAKGYVADSPLTLRHKAGKLTDVLFNGSVYKDDRGNVVGVVIVARDTTEQKRLTTELTEAIVFAELATGFAEDAKIKAENATLIAESAVKSKQQFLSNMSHEIRTPMNAIIGFTKVLLKTELTAKQKEYLTAIKLSGDALIVLINDILDLAKVDAGKMVFEQVPFKMITSLSAMLHLFESKIHEKNLKLIKEFDSKIPAILVGDPVRLHQIIINLVSNAVKFTNKGKITLSVRLIKEDEEQVKIQFSLSDTGIGIPENKIERIFENFQQASSGTSRLYGGTGLGLAIVKQLVEAQGGIIQVKSKVGEGSVFSFELDFLKTKADIGIEPEQDVFLGDLKNVRVLVAEDIPLNQLLMKTLLDDFGFECEIAENGKIAVEKLQNKTFSIVLMDLQMPEMNGFEATDYIRNKLRSDVPIIALTADVTTVDLAKCRAVGMNDYIAKPVDERLLYSKIVGAVKKSTTLDTLKVEESEETSKIKCTDLDYLNRRTKSNPALMMEMISLYLDQTPALVTTMKRSLKDKDWKSLYSAVHKLIPSFSIMGISPNFENMAKKVQEYASTQQQTDGILDLVLQLEIVCNQACEELKEDLITIKNGKDE